MKSALLFRNDFNQENILFLEDYVWISNFEKRNIENLKRENLTAEILLKDLSLGDLNNKSCTLIPSNNLSLIRLDLRDISNIFKNEINNTNFKKLLLKTKTIVCLYSMDELAELNELSAYFLEHSELVIDDSETIVKFLSIDLTI